MSDVHNRTRYLKGCRCDVCRRAQSEYRKKNRRDHTARRLAEVPAVPEQRHSDGSVAGAVRQELDGLAGVEQRPGMVAVTLAMAKILDDDLAIPQHPAAAARLMELLAVLRKSGSKRRGKLAAVREMTE